MAYQGIGTGTTPNDNSGDSLLTAALKINSNFKEIYNFLGDGTALVGFSTVRTVASSTTLAPISSENNGLFILEGPTSTLQLNNTSPVGTRFSVISKNSTNTLNRPSGTLIMGINEDLTLDSDYSSFDIIWTGSTFGWAIK